MQIKEGLLSCSLELRLTGWKVVMTPHYLADSLRPTLSEKEGGSWEKALRKICEVKLDSGALTRLERITVYNSRQIGALSHHAAVYHWLVSRGDSTGVVEDDDFCLEIPASTGRKHLSGSTAGA